MRKYLAVMLISGIVSCTNTEKKVAGNSDTTTNIKTAGVAVELKDGKVQAIYNGYISLKDALVSTKFEEAQKAALALKTDLANYKGCESTALIADKIATAADIKTQRKEFTSLSSDVIALFKHADLVKGSIYVQHCPMANNNDGGDWLSAESKIQNPYYGDEMMECGRIVEEIKSSK
ncbi:DUF3347 domain-containing protein [Pedobacter nyackensis]|uniref:DUF3347 domain-containing protein n=1 Tax=Pedobacter nyackensis TaxID=475255 RepID=A0A1W2DDZ3_9SPHI|nr:DUF3347 domain-containing protein [Pedobacter nyackensis]SMC95464.1 Protein of unknown function [Pedobacter nyackensis]